MVSRLAKDQELSIKRSCQLVNLSRAAYYREENKFAERDAPVVEALNGVVAKHGRWGFWKCHDRLRLEGHPWNHKRVWRVYCQMKTESSTARQEALDQTGSAFECAAAAQ